MCTAQVYCLKMSSHQTSSNKPRSSKQTDIFANLKHNYCPTCREAGKGDDPCVTNEKLCNICSAFTEEQLIIIKHRCNYVRKQKVSDTCNTTDKKKHKVWAKYFSQSSSSEEDQSSVPIKRYAKPQSAPSEQGQQQQQNNPDPLLYRELDMSDLPSQYAEEVETFKHILDLPDPRETMPRSWTSVLGLDNEKGQQELSPRGPSAMLPLSPYLKDAFEKFQQDFLASNLNNKMVQGGTALF